MDSTTTNDRRVPTHATAAEIRYRDGRVFLGRIFIPSSSSRHSGAMRIDEWMNETGTFFPFLPDDSKATVLLNRDLVSVLAVAPIDESDLSLDAGLDEDVPKRRIAVEVGDRRIEGQVVVDMPENQRRMLDYLNRGESFLLLRTPDRWFLIRKSTIARVVEIEEG
jgi:hypothetical protein